MQRAVRRLADLLGRDSWPARLLRPVYARLLLLLSGRRGIPWTINGLEYRIDPRARPLMGESYERPVASALRPRMRPGAVCLDVGANVGVYVLQFGRWTAPGGRVVAFEPNPGARHLLERHVAMNGLADRVTIVPAAVGAAPGAAVLFAAGEAGMSRLHAPNPQLADDVAPLDVPVVTVDDYCGRHGLDPDWMIVDIEGFELDALRGATDTITRRGAALGVVVELHPAEWSALGETRDSVERLFAVLGRTPVPLTGQRDPLEEHGLVELVPAERG